MIDMDPETLDGRFLGCSHERFTTSAGLVRDILDSHPGYHPRPKQGGVALPSQEGTDPTAKVAKLYDPKRKAEVVSYNMERFAKDCVSVFCEILRCPKAKFGTAPSPFLDESNDPLSVVEEPATTGTKVQIRVPRAPCPRRGDGLPTRERGLVSCLHSLASA